MMFLLRGDLLTEWLDSRFPDRECPISLLPPELGRSVPVPFDPSGRVAFDLQQEFGDRRGLSETDEEMGMIRGAAGGEHRRTVPAADAAEGAPGVKHPRLLQTTPPGSQGMLVAPSARGAPQATTNGQ